MSMMLVKHLKQVRFTKQLTFLQFCLLKENLFGVWFGFGLAHVTFRPVGWFHLKFEERVRIVGTTEVLVTRLSE